MKPAQLITVCAACDAEVCESETAAHARNCPGAPHSAPDLTAEQWVEIYYALLCKLWGIQRGAYGPEDEPGQDAAWIADLRAILDTIGIDGRNMTGDV